MTSLIAAALRQAVADLRRDHKDCPDASCPWSLMRDEDVTALVDRVEAVMERAL